MAHRQTPLPPVTGGGGRVGGHGAVEPQGPPLSEAAPLELPRRGMLSGVPTFPPHLPQPI